ncbi:MAG: hypothetical protein C5B52_14605 [Bacteroidetes bacterium]|nr:MAG: hypothetical protein C5B52_14605 [Bacteroidota bacterium]
MRFRTVLTTTILLLSFHSFAGPGDEGKTIFMARCAACHNVNKVIVGPALAGVSERRKIDWIVKFVHSSTSVIKSGDKDAAELFNQFNHIQMPDHADLSEDQIKGIVSYISAEAKITAGNSKAPFASPSKIRPAYIPLESSDYQFFIFFFAGIILLVVALLVLVRVKEIERSHHS